ncbi:hypothetical protein LAZ67_3004689 [Cordylochernes scorpioides]|uniref:Retrovirus-related Pol polyprotein from transposon TNT 1-94-like beta-barrel domain-containing protein n=1 Tax=Cordylochernes scorpioides TaxID=51811 RepID=A0ABY6KAP2_9ARAC|nr:hypothetical protein LAZ67_3004689 [Cordylochernes scorpioides]
MAARASQLIQGHVEFREFTIAREFLNKLAQEITQLGKTVTERELVRYIVEGLTPNFDTITAALSINREISLPDLRPALLDFEKKRQYRSKNHENAFRSSGNQFKKKKYALHVITREERPTTQDVWIIDSACTSHMTSHGEWIEHKTEDRRSIQVAEEGRHIESASSGSIQATVQDVDIEELAPDTIINRQTESSESDRSQRTRTIPKRFDDYVLATTNETIPKDYEEAIACEDKKHWENAMLEEIQNIYSHQVWELHTYQEALGMLMFLAVNTRPDIAYITSKLSQYSRQPKQMHWTAIKRVMRYLRGTIDLGVKFESGKTEILKSYTDASWSTTHDGKSYGGYVLKLGEATIDWKSSKQPLIALSTMEAEIIAACESCCQIKWIINLLRELEEWNFMEKPTAIYTDSQSLINWISSPKQSSRCRHINRKHHFLRDCYESRDICLLYKPSQDLEAGIFTKDLSRDQMKKHLENLSIVGIKTKEAELGRKRLPEVWLKLTDELPYERFKEGREESADNERSGRTSTSTTPEKVDKVLELVREDRRINVREVAEEAGISFGSTQSIVKDILGVRRLNAVLVPKDLTFDQKNARKETASLNLEATTELLKRAITGDETWIYGFDSETTQQAAEKRFKNEPRPKKSRKAPSKVKVMLTVFFDYQGIVHHEFQQQGSTITADSYLGVLRRLREAIRQKRPKLWRSKSWILHRDNAPAHTALKISNFLQDHSTSVFPQPPYSPDVAPCDFFIFGKLKEKS